MANNRNKLELWAPLPMRLAAGTIFFAHGAQKMLGWFGGVGFSGTMRFFQQALGVPAFLAVIAILVEFFGAIALLLGAATRWAAFALTIFMLVAMVKVHLSHGFFLNWELTPGRGHGFEYNIAMLGLTIALMLLGGGNLSIDRLRRER